MNPNPFNRLLHSRKFWLAVLDAIGSIGLLLITRYLSPADVELVVKIVAMLQPVILAVIGSIAWEDTANARAQGMVDAAVATVNGAEIQVAKTAVK